MLSQDNKELELIRDADDYLLSTIAPKEYDERKPESVVNQMDKSFEKICSTLEEVGVSNPKNLSIFEFESRIEYFREKNKAK